MGEENVLGCQTFRTLYIAAMPSMVDSVTNPVTADIKVTCAMDTVYSEPKEWVWCEGLDSEHTGWVFTYWNIILNSYFVLFFGFVLGSIEFLGGWQCMSMFYHD